MVYKAAIFDLDGTLVSTEEKLRYKVVGDTLAEFGKKASKEVIDRFWYRGERANLIKKEFGLEPTEFWEVFIKHDSAELRKSYTLPYEDVTFINKLRAAGIKIGLVTGAPTYIADVEIDLIGREKFDSIVVAHKKNGIRPKPDPHGIHICLKELGLTASDAIFIGNSDEDVLAARSVGMFDVVVDREEHDYTDLPHVPSLTVKSLFDLEKYFDL